MNFLQDIRFAFRVLVKNRWFTLMAALVLALGIGANNAVFTLVNAVLLRGLPFPNSDQIMMVLTRDSRGRDNGVSVLDFNDWQKSIHTFSNLSFVFSGSFNVGEEGRIPENYFGSYVSANFNRMIGSTPQLGRDFTPQEDQPGTDPVVLISANVWKQRYGSDPGVIGRGIRLNALNATIVGVMPEGMRFPNDADVWMPYGTLPAAITTAARQARGYTAIGRLRDGVTVDQARTELAAIGAKLAAEFPTTNRDLAPYPYVFNERVNGPQIKLLFWSLMGAVGFVLLVACSNVANLLLARAAHRSNEVSIRVALGASRWQVIRQLLIEAVLLSCFAGIFGLILSVLGVRWFDAQTQNVGKPYWMVFEMDWRTTAFFMAVCLLTGVVFGLAPALHVSRTNVSETLKEGGRSGSGGIRARRWTSALIVAQLALTMVLLAGAGFMMRSFLNMYDREVGINTSRLVTMQMILSARKYPSLEDRAAFLRRLDEQFATVDGIEAASTMTNPPLTGGAGRQLEIDGRANAPGERSQSVTMLSIGSRYFDAIGVRAVQGRVLTDADQEPGHPSVVVNQRLVAMYFKNESAIGRQIRLTDDSPAGGQAPWLTVVGVVPNVRQRNNNQEREPDAVAYIPHVLNTTMARAAMVIARARTANTAQATQSLREAMRLIDPDLALYNPRTMDEILAQSRFFLRLSSVMFGTFAVIGLVLAAVGLYAVTAYSVTQYTRDIGVRMVLGAKSGQVIWLFLRRAFVQLGIGLVIGLAGAFGVGRLLQSFLVQMSTRDPVTIIAITTLLIVVALMACLWPARYATRLDPLAALRHE
ncbi:MAG TPA: ABC transporter permease [Vicinamibacterales bacterium]|nr:ABC transporter permease [Vicinamibacterales bacterium]